MFQIGLPWNLTAFRPVWRKQPGLVKDTDIPQFLQSASLQKAAQPSMSALLSRVSMVELKVSIPTTSLAEAVGPARMKLTAAARRRMVLLAKSI